MNSRHTWRPLKKKPRWPNPEESTGRFYGEKQGMLCWRARGPAQEAFEQLAPEIKEFLNNCSNAVPGDDWVTWSVYMIGKSKCTAIPTIMFECLQKGPRKEAMELIRNSGILSKFPALETGHWPYPPHIVFPEQLALLSEQGDSTPSVANLPMGPQITARIDFDDTVEYRKSTIGGLLRMKGRNYYFTTSHSFSPRNRDMRWPPNSGDSDDECEFGTESDTDESEDMATLAELTSRGSRTPGSSSNHSLDIDEVQSGSLETLESEDSSLFSNDSSGNINDISRTTASNDQDIQILYKEHTSDVDIHHRGDSGKAKLDAITVSRQDLCMASAVLDYALILSHDDSAIMSVVDRVPVPFSQGIPFMAFEKTQKKVPLVAPIITWTGSSGFITGVLSGSPSYTRLPGSVNYQEVFTVNLDQPLHHGDCGSCVFDADNGTIYGHIVAGSTVSHVAYVIPAAVVFRDIELNMEVIDQSANSLGTESSFSFEFEKLAMQRTKKEPFPAQRRDKPTWNKLLSEIFSTGLKSVSTGPPSLPSDPWKDSTDLAEPEAGWIPGPNAQPPAIGRHSRRPIYSEKLDDARERPLTTEESRAARLFDKHAGGCMHCCNPYERRRNPDQLCQYGRNLAVRLVFLISSRYPEVLSISEKNHTPIHLTPLQSYVQVCSFLAVYRQRLSSSSSSSHRDEVFPLADLSRLDLNVRDGPDVKSTQRRHASFQCTLCPKRFAHNYNLRSHLRTHSNERPFVCSVCSRAFARQHDRKRHEDLHLGGRSTYPKSLPHTSPSHEQQNLTYIEGNNIGTWDLSSKEDTSQAMTSPSKVSNIIDNPSAARSSRKASYSARELPEKAARRALHETLYPEELDFRDRRGNNASHHANSMQDSPSFEKWEKDTNNTLSHALQKANTAVSLDNAQNAKGAIEAYRDACKLLQQVKKQSDSREEDQQMLDVTLVTYTNRIEELRRLEDPGDLWSGKLLQTRPTRNDIIHLQDDSYWELETMVKPVADQTWATGNDSLQLQDNTRREVMGKKKSSSDKSRQY